MLVGRRMEDQVRPVGTDQIVHPVGVAHRTDQHLQIQLREIPPKFHLNIVGVVLVNVKNNQLSGFGAGNLAAQFTADASAAAGDQHGLAGDIADDLFQINLNGLTSQQVLGIYIAQLADADFAVDHLENAGQHLYLAPGGGTDVQNLFALLGRTAGDGKDDFADLILPDHLPDLVAVSHNGNAAQPLVQFGGVVINDAGQPIPDKVAVYKFQRQGPSGIPRSNEHDIFHPGGVGRMADFPQSGPPQPVGEPDGHTADIAEQKAHHHTGPGNHRPVKAEQHHTDHSQHNIGPGDPEYLRGADKSPDAAVQPETGEHHHGNGAPGPDGGQVACQVDIPDIFKSEVRPKPQAKEKGNHGRHHIQRHNSRNLASHGKIDISIFSILRFFENHFFTSKSLL